MKRILIINHYWPPTGGACVQRWVDFSNYLTELGHNVSILTPENPGFEYTDYTLENRINKNVKVIKIAYKNIVSGARKTIGNNKLSLFIRGNFFLPDARKKWNKNAIQYIEKYIDNFDVIITAGPPHSTHFIGFHFRKRTKWIADFHDFWSDAIYIKLFHRTKLAHFIDSYYEKKILKTADCIFAHCQAAKMKYSRITDKKVEVIPMGFYDEFFNDNDSEVDKGVISHIGTFFESYSEALHIINDYTQKGFRFRQVGPVIGNIKFPPNSEFIPYVEHKIAIDYIKRSEILLLVNHENFLPGKIFEYLASMRKIELVTSTNTDAEKLILMNKNSSKADIFKKYSRKNLSIRISEIISNL